ncbi:MAG: protein-disulfide isomerase [Hyphomicrobiaceae bacterium]|jgi:protein-disulfide isomerase
MASHEQNSFVQMLTKPKGVLIAAPVLLGAALVLNVLIGGEASSARDDESANKNAAKVTQAGSVESIAEALKGKSSLIQLAAANKPATSAAEFSGTQRDEIGKIVREYLMNNPEVLVEVSAELEKRRKVQEAGKQAALLKTEKQSIFRSPHDFVLGNPDGDITVVEYFDYNCGWCKRALGEVVKLTQEDKNVRVVMKEFPIFGEHSNFAAKAALASIKQNKYWEFHTALMKQKQVTTENTFDIAKSVGIDVAALKAEMEKPQYDKAIQENTRVAQALGMQGTPGFIVDSRINFGYVPASGLKDMLTDIRKEGCKIC